MREKIGRDLPKIGVFIILLAVLALFGAGCMPQYSADSYDTFTDSSDWAFMLYTNGRIIPGLVYWLFYNVLHPSVHIVYYLSYGTGLLAGTLAVLLYYKKLVEYRIPAVYAAILAVPAVLNIYSQYYFLFIETGFFMLAILMNVIACLQFVHLLELPVEDKKGRRRAEFFCVLALLLAFFMYQGVMSLFIVLSAPFILYHSKDARSFLVSNLRLFVLYLIPAIIDFLIVKVGFASERTGDASLGIGSILSNLLHAFVNVQNFWFRRTGVLSNDLSGIFIIMLLLASLIAAWRRHSFLRTLLQSLYLFLLDLIFSFAPQIIGATWNWAEERSVYAFGSLLAVLAVNLFLNGEQEKYSQPRAKKAVILILCLSFLVQFFTFTSRYIDRYQTNQEEKYVARMIENRIGTYEQETGQTIDTICTYTDSNITYTRLASFSYWTNIRTYTYSWGDVSCLEFYLDRSFVKGEQDPEIRDYFMSQNWDIFSEDQLIFRGNTLHLCIY